MSLANLCTTTMTLQRPTTTAGTLGGQSSTFANVSGAVSILCTIQPASGRIIEKFAKREMDINYIAYTPISVSARAGDIVVDASSVKYIVKSWEDQAGRGQIFALYLLRMDQ